ncbi:hypothetical protein ACJMK2_043448 [Sinanodonta woodiana]|uniref:DDE-1 domain-containing protein n=1 Tax=Sinanodonta woodiana TaxID=1069815 RepID=A0ABD3VXF7_SINWO
MSLWISKTSATYQGQPHKPRCHQIELLGLPPHTTSSLQPLDVQIIGPLKAKFTSIAVNLGYINKNQIVNNARFQQCCFMPLISIQLSR